jgi:hypothetical protein
MHKILESYLSKFSEEHSLLDLDESVRFERFVNYCVLSSRYPDQFDTADITTEVDDDSIDGCAILIDEELVTTEAGADAIFRKRGGRKDLVVNYVFTQAKRSEGFQGTEITSFGAGVRRVFHGKRQRPKDELLIQARKIHELVVGNLARVRSGRPSVHLYYATTGVFREESGLRKYSDQEQSELKELGVFDEVHFYFVDRERLFKLWNQTRGATEASFSVRSSLPIPKFPGVEEAYICLASAPGFVDAVLSETDGRIRTSVFEQNVRAFLGEDNPVNARIRQTLEDEKKHESFALLNNGITIVSSDVRVQSEKVSVRDFQIVNGCQTSHVLYRNRSLLSDKISVPVKVIEADDPEVVSAVVEATNSQSDVADSQFLSIRPFVRRLEAYFNSFDNDQDGDNRLFFERRTRQYHGEDIGRARIFDILRLARCFASVFLDVPHLAARYPTQAIEEESAGLFQSDHRERAYYVAALMMYRLDLSLGNQYVPRKYQAYRWHLLWIVRAQLLGPSIPPLNSKRLDNVVDAIFDAMKVGGKAAAAPFLEAAKVLEKANMPSRDRIRHQRFVQELKSLVAGRGKIALSTRAVPSRRTRPETG